MISTAGRAPWAYKRLISDWREVLPAQSVCLKAPVAPSPPDNGAGAQRRIAETERTEND